MGVGITTAYRIKITNLACLNNIRMVPGSMTYGGLRWQIKVPLMLLGLCSIVRGFLIGSNLSNSTVLDLQDKVIPLIIIIIGGVLGFILTNFKNKNFSSMLMLRPSFQKTRFYAVKREIVKVGDAGFAEELGGPGFLAYLKNFFFSFHPLISVSLILMFITFF